ncbi:uncharacterized protein [Amphiura filiformis]|uniref:uncharacterized protein n=1 Tax=Amphiura filiformis TaxID=82378 RepID=UPI003B21873F
MADIDILGIDELLVIFNLLSLYDKLMAMRVCKKWYHIVRKTHAWKVIDFRDNGPVITINEDDDGRFYKRYVAKPGQNILKFREKLDWYLRDVKRWEFPMNSRKVLSFLGLFAGDALREIYLTVMSGGIMEFLRRTCPNIITFDFSRCYVESVCIDIDETINEKLYIPIKLKRLGLRISQPRRYRQNVKINELLLSCVANDCSELQSICLCNFELTSTSIHNLVKIPSLRDIELSSCPYYTDYTDHYSSEFDDILTNSIGVLETLTRLRIDEVVSHDLSTFLGSIGDWEHLRELALIHVAFSEEAFEKMIPGLINLKRLELQGYSISSPIVTLVGNECRKLDSLLLRDGMYSGKSLMSLSHHPTLELLEVQNWPYRRGVWRRDTPAVESEWQWLHTVFSMLETLPKIKRVKLWGKNVAKVYNKGTFPVLHLAEIEAIEPSCNEDTHKKQNGRSFSKNSFKRMFKR